MKKAIFSEQRIRIDGKFRRKQLLLHLDEVKHISLPCAVVLSAELKRWTIHVELIPKLVAFEKWDKRVRSLLISLGTLKHLGIQKKQYNAFSSKPFPGQVFLLELTSAKVQSGEKVSSIQEGTAKLADFFSPKPFIFRALLEATNNSIEHAYSLVEKQRFPNADGGRWYATASFDPNKDALRFFVYDQGIGIPATLETKSLWRSLVDDLRTKLGGEGDAGTIAAAIEVGRTRTELSERGKGLNDIVAVLERVGDGYVRIISARGDYTRHADGTVEQSNYSSHIGGTLIEWSLPVDAIRSEKPKYG